MGVSTLPETMTPERWELIFYIVSCLGIPPIGALSDVVTNKTTL